MGGGQNLPARSLHNGAQALVTRRTPAAFVPVPVAHLRHDPSKAGTLLFLQRELLPGGLTWRLSSFLERPPSLIVRLIRPLSHKTSMTRFETKRRSHIYGDQYRQLVTSAPRGAVSSMRCMIWGKYI